MELSFSTTAKGIAVHVDAVKDSTPVGHVKLEGAAVRPQLLVCLSCCMQGGVSFPNRGSS